MHPASGPPNANVRPLITSIFDFSAEALGELRTYWEQNPPVLPISQIIGFSGFTAQAGPFILTTQTTTSGTYTDLATVGPTLTGLGAGSYIIAFGCEAFNATAGNGSRMSISINGSSAGDNDECLSSVTTAQSTMRITTATLKNANNTITTKYRGDGGTVASFQRRWLVALKSANL